MSMGTKFHHELIPCRILGIFGISNLRILIHREGHLNITLILSVYYLHMCYVLSVYYLLVLCP